MKWALSISFILSPSSNSLGTEDTSRAHLRHHSSSRGVGEVLMGD